MNNQTNDKNSNKSFVQAHLETIYVIGIIIITFFALRALIVGYIIETDNGIWDLPVEIKVPSYIILSALLGSLAYLLSAIVGEYGKLQKNDNYLNKLTKLNTSEISTDIQDAQTKLDEFMETWIAESLKIWIKIARIPFGILMAVAFYYLMPLIVSKDFLDLNTEPALMAGISFLVALFPKLMMDALSGLASRLLSKEDQPDKPDNDDEN